DHGDKSGRGAEYSALEVFDGKLLTMDDRTGDVDEIFPNQEANDADARVGGRDEDTPLKAEWATQKAGKLVIGSTGKERTDDDSNVVHHGEMWIKTLEPGTLALTNIDGTQGYNGLRESALGQKSVGYMIHESGRWSDVHQKWFFLPRKLSRESYNEVSDNHKCVNLMLAAPDFLPGAGINPEYGNCLMQPYLGFLDTRGCSDFLFVPGSNDSHIFLMRTEESMEGTLTSYSSVIDLAANVLMAESKIMDDRKFEGAAWVHPKPQNPNPEPYTLHPKPRTPHPKPETRNPETGNRNPKLSTPNTKHQTPNTKHQTPNPKHQTPNPKLSRLAAGRASRERGAPNPRP
ncbi:apyrase-domain-containing protein, partial [Baffinella frigidus]